VFAFRALAHIARRAGQAGFYFGGATRSAAVCGMSVRQWRRALGILRARGFLEVVDETPGRPSTYRPTVDTGAPVPDSHRSNQCQTVTGATQAEDPCPVGRGGGDCGAHKGVPLKESQEGVPRRSKTGTRQSWAARPELSDLIEYRHTLLGGHKAATEPKVRAIERALSAGYTPNDLRRVFEAIQGADPEGRGAAWFCRMKNRTFEWSVRPSTVQAILDELEAPSDAPAPVTSPATEAPLFVAELAS